MASIHARARLVAAVGDDVYSTTVCVEARFAVPPEVRAAAESGSRRALAVVVAAATVAAESAATREYGRFRAHLRDAGVG